MKKQDKPRNVPTVTWAFPQRFEVKMWKEGEYYFYDYKEEVEMLPESKYGKDDTEKMMREGVSMPDCEMVKFENTSNTAHVIIKTKNPMRIIAHLINEVDYLGREPITEEDNYKKAK